MIIQEYIIVIIDTIAIFFQGFYLGRRSIWWLLASSLVLVIVPIIVMTINGMSTYSNIVPNMNIYEAVISMIYVIFLWKLGYKVSRITYLREKYSENNI